MMAVIKAQFAKVLWPQLKDVWNKVMVKGTHYYDEHGRLRKYKKGQKKWRGKFKRLFK